MRDIKWQGLDKEMKDELLNLCEIKRTSSVNNLYASGKNGESITSSQFKAII